MMTTAFQIWSLIVVWGSVILLGLLTLFAICYAADRVLVYLLHHYDAWTVFFKLLRERPPRRS